jgi:hypothetical protein
MLNKISAIIIFAVIISGMVLFCAGSGFAQPQGKEFIEQEDKNKDGKVARDEFGGPAEHFVFFDKNKDGFIDMSEVPGEGNLPPGGAPATEGGASASGIDEKKDEAASASGIDEKKSGASTSGKDQPKK